MPREKEDFRPNLERLNDLFPDREMLTVRDVQQVMGWSSVNTVKKYIPFPGPCRTISKVALARIMCGR